MHYGVAVDAAQRNWNSLCAPAFSLLDINSSRHTHLALKKTGNAIMTNLINKLFNDEAGFIVSAELVLVATITGLGLVVGLSEVALNVNNELEDVGSAFCSIQQSFQTSGSCGHGGNKGGSSFNDCYDFCSGQNDIH